MVATHRTPLLLAPPRSSRVVLRSSRASRASPHRQRRSPRTLLQGAASPPRALPRHPVRAACEASLVYFCMQMSRCCT